MSVPYNLRAVVEKTPNALLQKFFSKFFAFNHLDWKELAENESAPILECLKKSDEA